MHIHYLLSSHTVDDQMWDLVDQKWAAQRARAILEKYQQMPKTVSARRTTMVEEVQITPDEGREGATIEG